MTAASEVATSVLVPRDLADVCPCLVWGRANHDGPPWCNELLEKLLGCARRSWADWTGDDGTVVT